MYCIYKATNIVNGKVYIGKTNNFERRKWEHLNRNTNHFFSRALQKYGYINFEWSILEDEIKTLEESNLRERYWIKSYNSYFRWPNSNGYNMTKGGDGGSDWNLKRVAAYTTSGELIASFDTVTKCTDHFGIQGTSSISHACDKMRLCSGMMFRSFKEAPLEKIEPYKFENPKKKKICRLDLCGNLVEMYDGILNAEKQGYKHTGIIGCLKGRYKQSYGYQWCYAEELDYKIGVHVEPIKALGDMFIAQYSLEGKLIAKFCNCAEAARKVGAKSNKTIHKALSSKSHIAHGYKWLKGTTHQYDNTEVSNQIAQG